MEWLQVRNQWRCDHCHVARFKWVGIVEHETRIVRRMQKFLAIGMEYAAGGELFNVVKKGYFREENQKRQLFAELLSAVEVRSNASYASLRKFNRLWH